MMTTTLLTLMLAAAGASPASAACLVSAGTWQNAPLGTPTGTFTASFDAAPSAAKMDGVIGLSAEPAASYSGLATAVRFNNAGYIDARNGGVYAAATAIPYVAGATYRFRLVVTLATHRYDAYVATPGAQERLIGGGYAFRTEQAAVSSLNHIGLFASTGSESVCDPSVAPPPAPAPVNSTSTLSEDFGAYPKNICLADGAVFGPWTSLFNGYGCTSVKTDGTASWLEQAPLVSPSPTQTHAAMVLGPSFSAPITLSAEMTTVAQLRTGSAPNAWEVGWLVWGYVDNTRFYYVALKPNGWELGKADPAYPGAQRFLATGSTPLYPIGAARALKIVQTQNVISVYADGALLTTFTDAERPYLNGRVGLYNEDARVRFGKVAVNVAAPAPPPAPAPETVVAQDAFGVAKLYPTMAGGTEWTSKWANGVARTFGWGDDPSDAWLHGKGDAVYKVDGKGQLFVSGAVPRLYLFDPSLMKSWRGVEMTVYAKRVSDTGIAYGGIVGVARTNHTANNSNLCDTRGMAARFRYDGRVDLEKETSHPSSTVVNSKSHFTGGMPKGTWIGWKYVVYDLPSGNVKLESYMDLTDGAGGGTWVKVNELTDTGKNFGVGGTRCKPGMDPALRLTASSARAGSETGKPNLSVYWRSDGVGTDGLVYKKMSVREIAPGGSLSVAESDAPSAAPAAAGNAKAPQKFLSPARADGVNDAAVFGPEADEVAVFSAAGRLVFSAKRDGGPPLVWDGKDGAGRVQESGIYIAKIRTSDAGVLYQSFALVK